MARVSTQAKRAVQRAEGARGKPRRVLGYARVSSQAQSLGSSLEDQQRAITRHAASVRCVVETFYVEAVSAVYEKIESREKIRALMADAREGDLVVCDKLDRWSRDPEFTYRSIRELREKGVQFYAVSEECDPSTKQGDRILDQAIQDAKREHARIKERMVGTRVMLRDRGYYVEGLPPFGYRRSLPKGGRSGEAKNVLVLVDEEAALVRRSFALCIAGQPLSKIAEAIGMEKSRVASMLRQRVYTGKLEDTRGEWIDGKHPRIIDDDTFTQAGQALDARRHTGPRPREGTKAETSDWILRDVARCAKCGAKMGAAYGGPRGARRHYYRCTAGDLKGGKACGAPLVRVDRVEEIAGKMALARLTDLRGLLAAPPKRPAKPAPTLDLTDQRARLQRKRAKYQEAFADDLMTRDELHQAIAKLDAEVVRLDGLDAASRRAEPLDDAAKRRAFLGEVARLRGAWNAATPAERRKVVGYLVRVAALAMPKPKGAPSCAFAWRSAEDMAAGRA